MAMRGELLKLLDALTGRVLALLLGNGRATVAPASGRRVSPPSRVLVIRPGGIGDAVLFIPMLRALREIWPKSAIDLLMERRNCAVLEGSSFAKRVYCYDRFPGDLLRVLRTRYDVVIDTEQYHHLSAFVAWLTRSPRRIGFGTTRRRRFLSELVPYSQEVYEARAFLDLAQAATGREVRFDPDRPFFLLPEEAVEYAEQTLASFAGRAMVAIHPGASIPERRWGAGRYAALARRLAEKEVAIIILGGPSDLRAAAKIRDALTGWPFVDLAGRCSLVQAAALVERAWVYISADTGVLHLAYGVGTPTVHLFGPGVLSKWGPPGRRFITVESPVPCSPCTRYGYTPPCNQGRLCMERITPDAVFDAVWSQLERAEESREATGEQG